MRKDSKDFLVRLLDVPAPSSREMPAQRVWRARVEPEVDRIEVDVYGNHVAVLEGPGQVSVMLVGHVDEIGLIVRRIDDEGMLWFGKIGGVDPAVLAATRVRVLSRGGEVPGVVGQPAIHLQDPGQAPKKLKLTELCIDIGATSRKEAEKLVAIGDRAVFGEDFRALAGGFAGHRCFDDRVGGWIVAETVRRLARAKGRKATVYGVSSVQEETGVWGAGLVADRLTPTLAIAIDVTHDTTTPGISRTALADVKCGRGPVISRGVRVHHGLVERLEKAARAAKVPFQTEIDEGSTFTDADPISNRRAGIPVANLSVPCRYMHTPCEVVSLDDLERSVTVLTRFVLDLGAKIDLVPR